MLRGDAGDREGDVGTAAAGGVLWTDDRKEGDVGSSDEMGLDKIPDGGRIDTGDTDEVGSGIVRTGEGGILCDRE